MIFLLAEMELLPTGVHLPGKEWSVLFVQLRAGLFVGTITDPIPKMVKAKKGEKLCQECMLLKYLELPTNKKNMWAYQEVKETLVKESMTQMRKARKD